jgi:Rod binding domain-containing protein
MADLPAPFAAATAAVAHKAPPKIAPSADDAKMRAAAEEFEAVFLAQILENMFQGIPTDGPFGGGHGESVYRSLMLQEYGKVIAQRGGIGVADAVMREMIKLQEAK